MKCWVQRFFAFASLAAVGCASFSQTVDITKVRPPYRVVVYDQGGPVLRKEITRESEDEATITRWLESNKSGWRATPVTYAPKRLIDGDGFSINFLDGGCVINYSTAGIGNGGVQLYKAIPKENLELSEVFAQNR